MFEYQKLNQRLWDSYSNFNNAGNNKTEKHEIVQKLLETLLDDIQHESGLIYAPISNQQPDNSWTVVNLSPQIQHQIDTQKGEIPDLLKSITNQNEIPDKFPEGIALISPLMYASEFLGLFVLEEDSTPDLSLNNINNKTDLLSEKLYLTKLNSNLE